ncbi:MAG: anhydro-N-acetylmuramic acid kinase [Burkholderiaceae bacterium]
MSGQPEPSCLYAGVMTGTSLDGIDLGLIRVAAGRAERLDFAQAELPGRLRQIFAELHDPEMPAALLRAAEAGIALAREISVLVASRRELWKDWGPVRAMGVHGQTVVHRPERGVSIQLNAPAWIAEQTGIDVVSDFRSRDIAAGGQGAPLVPLFHEVMARSVDEAAVAVVNLGGIANISLIRRQAGILPAQVSGFDTGPANMLLDYWAQKTLGRPFDENGQLAMQGRAIPTLVARMAEHPFFAQQPPKSTGRDAFHGLWLEAQLAAHQAQHGEVSAADVQASLVALTAQTITEAVPTDLRRIYLCGGGAKNPVLKNALEDALTRRDQPVLLLTSDALGWPVQEVEAAAFAWLAHCCVAKIPASLPAVTGAKAARVLGSITPSGAAAS